MNTRPFVRLIHLNRYLIMWRVNRSLVRLPPCLPVELSWVLGSLIAERLPTPQARPWRKALAGWADYADEGLPPKKNVPVPEARWPLEAVLFVYPGKQTYGLDELIVWELKLIGSSADHSLFLEVILPAMEEASATADPRWHRPNSLWGRFDVHAVYAAHGSQWKPVVQAGRLDLSCRATPIQWADGLALDPIPDRTLDRLTWLTPFDLPARPAHLHGEPARLTPASSGPTLQDLIEALAVRLSLAIPGRRHAPADVWNVLSDQDRAALKAAIEQAGEFPLRQQQIKRAPRHWPGRWIGTQRFLFIPDPLVPYLELAAILHLGKQTHFGCGTFSLA